MISASQMRDARALVDMDQRTLAEAAGFFVPRIQCTEASEAVIRGYADSLVTPVDAPDAAGME